MKIGLFFGSFNPIHLAHLSVAQWFLNNTDLEQILFVISPQNPFKNNTDLLHENDRLDILKLSIQDNPKFDWTDVEFNLEKPSYTYITLNVLKNKYPNDELFVIMGTDSLISLPNWMHVESILNFPIYVYKRQLKQEVTLFEHHQIKVFETPILEISATNIRALIQQNKSIKYLVHPAAEQLIFNLYRQ